MIDSQWSEGEIVDIKFWTEDLISVFIKSQIEFFKPGQFVKVGFVNLETAKPVSRCYSIVSAPRDEIIEIYLNRVDQGTLTPRLFESKPGDRIVVSKKPAGIMTLDNVRRNPNLWLVATGTGVGPFISMLRDEEVLIKFKNIFVLHGVRVSEHLAYRSVFKKHRADVIYVPCVTNTTDPQYFNGRVTDYIQQSRFEKVLTKDNSSVVACGHKQMIEDVKTVLKNKGFPIPSDLFVHEKYW